MKIRIRSRKAGFWVFYQRWVWDVWLVEPDGEKIVVGLGYSSWSAAMQKGCWAYRFANTKLGPGVP